MSFDVITKIQYNQETGLHSIVEGGYRYELPSSLFSNFKTYLLQYDLVSRWYKQLSDTEREMVNRTNAYL